MNAPIDADLLAVDVGNTTTKVGVMRRGVVLDRRSFPHDAPKAIERLLEYCSPIPAGSPAAIAGVRPDAQAEIAERIAVQRRVGVAPVEFQSPLMNACDPPESVGQDRLFAAAGAVLDGGAPVIVVDVGTAITVDRIDAGLSSPVFVGGTIAPGVELSLRALHRDTGQLPLVDPDGDGAPLGRYGTRTEEAIRVGVVRGLAGLVDRLVADLRDGEEIPVVLSGGGAPRLFPLLTTRPRLEPELILRGIAHGALRCGLAGTTR